MADRLAAIANGRSGRALQSAAEEVAQAANVANLVDGSDDISVVVVIRPDGTGRLLIEDGDVIARLVEHEPADG